MKRKQAKPRWPAKHRDKRRHRVVDGERQTRIDTRDPTAYSRWCDRNAHPRTRARPGCDEATKEAREQTNRWTLVCRRCGGLVDWRCAKRHGNATKTGTLSLRAGCGGPRCAKRHHATRYTDGQRRMATRLRDGERDLVAWPKDAADTVVWLRPREAAEAAVASVLDNA